MLDLHKLMIFRRVATFGSFSKAAQELALTQSAVSQHIQDLERSLGVTLFQRMSRGAQPTEAGLRLCDHTDELFRVVAKIEHDLVDIRDSAQRHLSVSASAGLSEYVLPEWIAAFQGRHSNIRCALRTAEPAEALNDLDRQRSDICVVEGAQRATIEGRHFETRVVGKATLCLVFGRESALFDPHRTTVLNGACIALACYESGTDLRQRAEKQMRLAGINYAIAAEFASTDALLRVARTSAFAAVVPDYALKQEPCTGDLMRLPLTAEPSSELLIVRRSDVPPAPSARAFFDFVEELSRAEPALLAAATQYA
jgi:LysR family transcriptional regulator, low CO2-responsive transcriptional regulator